MEHNDIFNKAQDHVVALFTAADTSKLVYHTLEHTRRVVGFANEMATHYNLIDNDRVIVILAAWFHDAGYLYAAPEVHEEKSVELMKAFMSGESQFDAEITTSIEACIMATKWPAQPHNLLQQIVVDADTYHLGTKEFFITNEMVYREHVNREGYISRKLWDEKAVIFLETHRFYTAYCKDQLQERKKKNIKKLKKELKEMHEILPEAVKEKAGDKASANLITKGIQTMLRLTSENHIKLSDMADGKANILISVNAIIISVILSVLLRKLQTEPYLTIPTLMFLGSSMCTIVIAILATRPKVTEGTFSEQDIIERKTNLLFFGNFYKVPHPVYEKAMKTMMQDPDYLYSSLIKDIYFLGTVLARKYKLIRWAYNVFMIGIVLSVIAFGLAAILTHGADAVVTNAQGSPL